MDVMGRRVAFDRSAREPQEARMLDAKKRRNHQPCCSKNSCGRRACACIRSTKPEHATCPRQPHTDSVTTEGRPTVGCNTGFVRLGGLGGQFLCCTTTSPESNPCSMHNYSKPPFSELIFVQRSPAVTYARVCGPSSVNALKMGRGGGREVGPESEERRRSSV